MLTNHIRILLLLGIVLASCQFVTAQICWSYMDYGVFLCGGAGGCEGEYPRIYCMLGCISGSCNPDGNSTECCGRRYDYAQGYQWGNADCHGLNCGEKPSRARRQERRSGAYTAALNPKPQFAQLPRILFVPSRCTHEYVAVFEDFTALPEGGL